MTSHRLTKEHSRLGGIANRERHGRDHLVSIAKKGRAALLRNVRNKALDAAAVVAAEEECGCAPGNHPACDVARSIAKRILALKDKAP